MFPMKKEGSSPASVACLGCTKILGDLLIPEFSCAGTSVSSPQRVARRINQHSFRDAQMPSAPGKVFWNCCQPRNPFMGCDSAVPGRGMGLASGRQVTHRDSGQLPLFFGHISLAL